MRKPRTLVEVDRWKATEFRQFLLYTGKIVLKGILEKDAYEHFLTLSVAMCILLSQHATDKLANFAHRLVTSFVRNSVELYGDAFSVYNVHMLLHLSKDSIVHKGLDNCCAFRFENYMQQLLKKVKSGKNPLSQIIRRHKESIPVMCAESSLASSLSAKRPNNSYLLKNGSCCEILEILPMDSSTLNLSCQIYRSQDLFCLPCPSSLIGVFLTNTIRASVSRISSSELRCKAILLEFPHGKIVFQALAHEFMY